MDPSIEIASGFTIGDYHALRRRLNANQPTVLEWTRVLGALRARLYERFVDPIRRLERCDKQDPLPMRPGFAILALDCLLIDTIQSFREGRATTGEVSPALSFKTFLRDGADFSEFNSADRDDFFKYVRNGLLHNGETRENWKVRIDTPRLLTKDPVTGSRTINRRLFHAAVLGELRRLQHEIATGPDVARTQFLRRMDSICQWLPVKPKHTYFAYGSNLLLSEITTHVPNVEEVGLAYLPGYRLAFDKHSEKWDGDAANIHRDWSAIVWGYIYRVDDEGLTNLRNRERGYSVVEGITPLVVDGSLEKVTPISAMTFASNETCSAGCGPTKTYLDLVMIGAVARGAEKTYLHWLECEAGPLAHREL